MAEQISPRGRRTFLQRVLGATGLVAAAPVTAAQTETAGASGGLPSYARAQSHRSLKQSSFDRTGGNADRWVIAPGATQEVFLSEGPGVITHIWCTIAAPSPHHLKEIVLRMYWEGNAKPSVETPIGDFFGLNLGQYVHYESAFLACSPGRSLNCYFAMPFRKSARITVTNEGKQNVNAFYSNIDYMLVGELPADTLYFHAQYRQATPCVPATGEQARLNPDGKLNYVYAETRGRGHLMGVTLGVLLNADGWMTDAHTGGRVSPRSSTINPEGSRKKRASSPPLSPPTWTPGGRMLKRSTIVRVSLVPAPISA
ncbi:MAG: DUF2961 domain-containing protein [Bryobacteraceae bacterium]|nr:DUF2961 domain-containing protein [Bryobacteraceae bacterium]